MYICVHSILFTPTGLSVEDVHELGEMLEVLRHLRRQDHVDDVVPQRLVRFAVEILEYVHAVIIYKGFEKKISCDSLREFNSQRVPQCNSINVSVYAAIMSVRCPSSCSSNWYISVL